MKQYIALFEFDEESGSVGVVFPDLEGCFSSGKDYEDAVRNAHEAIALYAENVENMPEPRTLEQIQKEWDCWEEWKENYNFTVGIVGYIPFSKPKKYTVYLDSSLMERIDTVTKNRSAFLAQAAEALLDNKSCINLLENQNLKEQTC